MPAFIQFHPYLLAAAVAALIGTLRGVPGSLRPWVRYLAIVGATTAVCMASTIWWPILATYEIAATLCFLPIVLLGMVGAIELMAHRATVMTGMTAITANRHADLNRRAMVAAALAGLLSAAIYLLHAAWLPP